MLIKGVQKAVPEVNRRLYPPSLAVEAYGGDKAFLLLKHTGAAATYSADGQVIETTEETNVEQQVWRSPHALPLQLTLKGRRRWVGVSERPPRRLSSRLSGSSQKEARDEPGERCSTDADARKMSHHRPQAWSGLDCARWSSSGRAVSRMGRWGFSQSVGEDGVPDRPSLKLWYVNWPIRFDAGRVKDFETTCFSIYCSDSTLPMREIDRPSSVGPGRLMDPCSGSSGVTIAPPVGACSVGGGGGLIHTAVGKVSRR
ncbi:MAG: hypothetical protein IMZ69_11030, partial [Spirochaetes bacterium]|nr:hypothetical protein [Spirochaetota bacterium]